MSKLVCNYAPIRFLPYREIGEFVNVGLVLHCPQTNQFDYRLVGRDGIGRVLDFFPELDAAVFEHALEGITRELQRVRDLHCGAPPNPEPGNEVIQARVESFREFVRRREGLLHFGDAGSLVADAPEAALNELFNRYVERQLAKRADQSQPVVS